MTAALEVRLGAVSKESLEWDAQAATFDSEPDHGLLDPNVRRLVA